MKIFGVGMNYAQHNKEVENTLLQKAAVTEKHPVIFTKADSSLLKDHKPFFIPDFMGRIDYEAEVVVRICRLGKAIPERFAHRYYDKMTVGIDFTARDMQKQLREEGLPWDICKGFDGSAVIGDWIDVPENASQGIEFNLDINGETVQRGNTSDMITSIDSLISYISQFFMLKTGDLIFTGTPAGVGPVKVDDHLEGYLGASPAPSEGGERVKVLDFWCR